MSFWRITDYNLISSVSSIPTIGGNRCVVLGIEALCCIIRRKRGWGWGAFVRVPRATRGAARGAGHIWHIVVCFHPAATCQVYFVSCFLLFCIGRMPKGHGSDSAVQSMAVISIIQT